jgi:hypothetical protein
MAETDFDRFTDTPDYARAKRLGDVLTTDEISVLADAVHLASAVNGVWGTDPAYTPVLDLLKRMMIPAVAQAYTRERGAGLAEAPIAGPTVVGGGHA